MYFGVILDMIGMLESFLYITKRFEWCDFPLRINYGFMAKFSYLREALFFLDYGNTPFIGLAF